MPVIIRVEFIGKKKELVYMIYTNFQEKDLPLLGFGTMRFPKNPDGTIDEAQVAEMTRYAMEHGVNYFDTAWPYHGGESERVIGRVLKAYPRESFYLADKFPGHMKQEDYSPAPFFEAQLEKCGVEYFDFYLLHNVWEKSMDIYMDPQYGILEYFKEQKRLGRIKHLGFSTHAELPCLKEFLDIAGDDMEFCQIQLNYLDWTLQDAKAKYDLLTERGIPVWVMEPVRGGKLAILNPDEEARLKAIEPEKSVASWGFRFLQTLPNVQMVLSGMSDMIQMMDNVNTFDTRKALSHEEVELVLDIAESIKNTVPCTACRYCTDGCPAGLEIPDLLAMYNQTRYTNVTAKVNALPAEKQPSACVACGKCVQVCPQNIEIPAILKDLAEKTAQ